MPFSSEYLILIDFFCLADFLLFLMTEDCTLEAFEAATDSFFEEVFANEGKEDLWRQLWTNEMETDLIQIVFFSRTEMGFSAK